LRSIVGKAASFSFLTATEPQNPTNVADGVTGIPVAAD